MKLASKLNGPPYAKTCLRAYADSEVQDQPAHLRSLSKAFVVATRIIGYYKRFQASRKHTYIILTPLNPIFI